MGSNVAGKRWWTQSPPILVEFVGMGKGCHAKDKFNSSSTIIVVSVRNMDPNRDDLDYQLNQDKLNNR